jgi:uncharacterized phage-associated protein
MSPVAAPYDARAIANFLLDLADERGLQLTQLSLYKIIYFGHGWYLSVHNTPLIRQEFEAWQHGPVIKVICDSFRSFGKNPIVGRASQLDLISSIRKVVSSTLREDDAHFMISIFNEYYIFDAWQLSDMTHEVGSPWDKLWNSPEPVGRLGLRLRNDEIKAHFDGIARRFRVS